MESPNHSYNKNIQPKASALRHEMTKAEACLWKYALKANQLGVSFRRQRPIFRYIADFVCLPLKLIIEVDGYSHHFEETIQKDEKKENDLRVLGYEIIRFTDDEVLNDIKNVVRVIACKIEELNVHPLPPPAGDIHPLPPPAGDREKYWLVKFAPFRYSWRDTLRNGRFEIYSVRNYQSRNNLQAMQLDDLVLFYHSQEELQVMGIMKVIQTAHQDPTTADSQWVSITFEPVDSLRRPVSLSKIKSNPALQHIALIHQARLAVMPLQKEEFDAIINMVES